MRADRRAWTLFAAVTVWAWAAAPAGAQELEPGLVTALDRIGGNLLGTAAFDAVLSNPPEPVLPQTLRLFVSRTSHLELVLNTPPEPVRLLLQMIVGGEEVELQLDSVIAGGRVLHIEETDLSGINPPDPVR